MSRSFLAYSPAAFTLLAAFLSSANLPPAVLAAQVIWDGAQDDQDDPRAGDGILWADNFNWSTDAVPGPSDDADVGMGRPLVRESELFQIGDLDVGVNGGLDVRGTLNSTGDSIRNDGEIVIDNGPSPGPAALGVAVGTLDGSGEIILGDSDFANSGARLVGPAVDGSAIHAAGHTIRGEGTLTGNWINRGMIIPADVSGDATGVLRIQGAMTNEGTLQTSATASLALTVDVAQGPAGRIVADANKVVFSGAAVTGGTLQSLNGGVVEGNSGTSRLAGVRNQATINMTGVFGSSLRIEGAGIVNDGTIVIASDPTSVASLFFASPASELGGSGQVILNRTGLNARIQAADGAAVGINGPSHTIRGVGAIDATLVNHGTIVAEPRGGDTVLELHDSNSDSSLSNNGVLRADAGATLRLSNVKITQNNATGRIVANQGTVELRVSQLNQPLVAGGRFQTVGDGEIVVAIGTRIDDVANEGRLQIRPGASLRLGGANFVNDGTVTLESVSVPFFNAATMFLGDGLTLSGDGEIVLAPTGGSAFHSLRVETGHTATQAAGHTIRGEGVINCCGSFGTFVNNGRIEGASAVDDVEVNGTLRGVGALKNVTIGGTHAPGQSTASVPIEGSYAIRDFGGRLEIEIGGTNPGSHYDQLVSLDPLNQITIGTSATTLAVSLIDLGNSYLPAAGDAFTILSSPNAIVGEFDVLSLPSFALGRAITWAPVDRTDPTKYVLRIAAVSTVNGDYDLDGDVDGADVLVWQRGGSPNPNSPGDLAAWEANFGFGAATTAAATVPEPAALPALGAAAVSGLSARRRKLR